MANKKILHEYDETGITISQFVDIAKKSREEWLKISQKLRFDINEHVEEEQYVLSVKSEGEYWNLAGLGAIGIIAGPPKSRKTVISSAIAAAGINGREVLGWKLDVKDGDILYFDTEQRQGSFAKVQRNVYKWGKVPIGSNPEHYKAFFLRELYPDERLEMIKAHMDIQPKPKLLVIDIITDLMYDFNDLVKSQRLVEDIMKLAGRETLTILSMHLGKGGLILGHLGSAFARKVDFLLEVTLDEEDKTKSWVECKLTRDVPMFPKFAIQQERHPERIFRPDLEMGGYFSGEESVEAIPISSGGDLRRFVEDDDDVVPF